MGTLLAISIHMNGADPTTPEELERILRTVSRTSHIDVEDGLYDDFDALCRVLAMEHSTDMAGALRLHR